MIASVRNVLSAGTARETMIYHLCGEKMSKKCVYALGFFDGVHLGHASLLSACRLMADELDCDAGVVTFSNHPDALVHGAAPGLINTLRDRDRLLKEEFHMDTVVTLPFDRALMRCPWQNFFHRLRREFGAAGLVCGEDFRFGYRGQGDARGLLEACREAGIPCVVLPQLKIEGVTVSSSYIRSLIEMGLMEQAVHFLGHPHILTGIVVPGHQLGRRLGFPTANLVLPEELVIPKFGVYVCSCLVDGERYAAVTNVGTRPTVAGVGVTVETWLLDYTGDLYGREITLEFHKFLRPELKFPSLEALQEAVRDDAEKTKKILKDCMPHRRDSVLFS